MSSREKIEKKEKGSLFIVMPLKAQINALKIMMNRDYFFFFFLISLYNKLLKKIISPQCSQCVPVAFRRGGMVYTNKLLWEFLIYKTEWYRNKDENIKSKRNKQLLQS